MVHVRIGGNKNSSAMYLSGCIYPVVELAGATIPERIRVCVCVYIVCVCERVCV